MGPLTSRGSGVEAAGSWLAGRGSAWVLDSSQRRQLEARPASPGAAAGGSGRAGLRAHLFGGSGVEAAAEGRVLPPREVPGGRPRLRRRRRGRRSDGSFAGTPSLA